MIEVCGVTMKQKPPAPDLPQYVLDTIEGQSPERLKTIARYAEDLRDWKLSKRQQEIEKRRAEESIEDEEREELEEQGISTDPDDYDIPSKSAYITVKETKPGYHYYYWQWRDGDSWKNEYIAPVNPKE